MPAALIFRLTTDDGDTLELDLDGELRWDQPERVYRDSAEPPELESIRYAWEVRGAARLTPDGSVGGGWTAFRADLALLDSRSDPVVKAEVVRVEGGVETVELTLGPPDYEAFRVERVSGDEPYDLDPKATHLKAWPIALRLSAQRLFTFDVTLPGSVTVANVVGLEQTISQDYDEAGLGTITWETTVTTRAGTDARPKAIAIGKIPRPGSSWAYETNGSDGVSLEVLDPDDSSSSQRIPSKVRATCRVRQYGVTIGTGSPGALPGRVSITDQRDDDGKEIIRTVEASALGPGAEAWVRQHKPSGAQEESTREDQGGRGFQAQWTVRTPKNPGLAFTVIAADVNGGFPDFDYEPVPGGYEPVRFDGAILPWTLTISVRVSRRGGTGVKAELPLPPLLRSPWTLDRRDSSEGQPLQEDVTATAEAARWVREARLVYRASQPPAEDPVDWLRQNAAASVPSYWLPK